MAVTAFLFPKSKGVLDSKWYGSNKGLPPPKKNMFTVNWWLVDEISFWKWSLFKGHVNFCRVKSVNFHLNQSWASQILRLILRTTAVDVCWNRSLSPSWAQKKGRVSEFFGGRCNAKHHSMVFHCHILHHYYTPENEHGTWKNHPIEKENYFPNFHFWVPC